MKFIVVYITGDLGMKNERVCDNVTMICQGELIHLIGY